MSTMDVIAWIVLAAGFLLGALGTVLPGLPGAILIFAGALIHKSLMPNVLSWWTVSILGALALVSWIVDLAGGLLGARIGGATRAGIMGAGIGGAVGLLFGIPGLILGPFFGAIAGDLYAKRRDLVALFKSGGGAAAGFLFSLVARVALLIAMAIVLAADLLIL